MEFSVEQRDLQDLARRMREEDDGKKMIRAFARDLRRTVEPATSRAESRLMSIGHRGSTPTEGRGLRETVREAMKSRVRTTGNSTGITVWVSKRDEVRGLDLAGRRLNRRGKWRRGWRHPVYGNRKAWVNQVVHPDLWFDKPMRDTFDDIKRAAREVLDDVAKRLS